MKRKSIIRAGSIIKNTVTGEMMMLLEDVRNHVALDISGSGTMVSYWYIPKRSVIRGTVGTKRRASFILTKSLEVIVEGPYIAKKRKSKNAKQSLQKCNS